MSLVKGALGTVEPRYSMSLEHSMQASVQPRHKSSAATRLCHTDQVSVDTAPHILTITSKRAAESEGAKLTTSTNGTLERQTVCPHTVQLTSKTQALQNPIQNPTEHGYPVRPLASIGLTQTLAKLHLFT